MGVNTFTASQPPWALMLLLGDFKHVYSRPTTLGPDATLNTEIHKNLVRIKALNSQCIKARA